MKKQLYKIRKVLLGPLRGREDYYRNYYYDNMFTRYNDPESYLTLYKKCTNNSCLKTNVEICFSKSLKFGSTLKEVKAKIYKSHVKSITPLNIEILFFKMLMGSHKVKCQMHFFKNNLFLYNYTFSDINEGCNNEIIDILQKKYIADSENYAKQNIIDNFNNCLQIEDSVDLTINYLSLNSDFFRSIALLSISEEEQRRRKNYAQYNDIYNRI